MRPIFSNHDKYSVHGIEGAVTVLLKETLRILKYESSPNNIYVPIVLGTPYSSWSDPAAMILNADDMGLISESTSAITLSDTYHYPYFYRFVVHFYYGQFKFQ